MLVAVDYPFGFDFSSSSPKADSGQNVWQIDDLKPSEKRIIVIQGRLNGQDNEERSFLFRAGIPSDKDPKTIGATFVSSLESILLKKPFIGLRVEANRDVTGHYVSKIDDSVNVKVTWTNNLPTSLLDSVVEVHLSGAALDRPSVAVDGSGFYRSIDDTVILDRHMNPKLAEMNPGESNSLTFRFDSLPLSQSAALRQPEINLDVKVSGSRLIPGSDPEQVFSSMIENVRIASNLVLNSQVLHSIGPFLNTGLIPPKAEQETTYTIVWSISNSFNDVSGTQVRAILPEYVRWLKVFSPSSERISFNDLTREIVWNVGEVKAGVGIGASPRQISFQIAFLPSLSQVGTNPTIVNSPRITALDTFTNTAIDNKKDTLTTDMRSDPAFHLGDERVVR